VSFTSADPAAPEEAGLAPTKIRARTINIAPMSSALKSVGEKKRGPFSTAAARAAEIREKTTWPY
jgi:hypothetical protein